MSFFNHLLRHWFVVNVTSGVICITNVIAKLVLKWWALSNRLRFAQYLGWCIEIQILNLHFFIEKVISKSWLYLRVDVLSISSISLGILLRTYYLVQVVGLKSILCLFVWGDRLTCLLVLFQLLLCFKFFWRAWIQTCLLIGIGSLIWVICLDNDLRQLGDLVLSVCCLVIGKVFLRVLGLCLEAAGWDLCLGIELVEIFEVKLRNRNRIRRLNLI